MKLQGIAATDFQGLSDLKLEAKKNAQEALPAVAKQFEGIFLQSMLKTMRMGQHFLAEDSPFSGKNQATFQEMLDGQFSTNIANSRGIGLAAMLAKQLEKTVGGPGHKEIDKTVLGTLNDAAPKSFAMNTALPTVKTPDSVPKFIAPVSEVAKTDEGSTGGIDDFVKSIWPMAKEAASVMGLDPKILMAQAALETGWGKFVAKDANGNSSNNLFNIKTGASKEHESVQVKTTEYIADTPIHMSASFRKYSSIEHSFNDYVSLIKGSDRYQNALANASNPELYVNELHKAGYATDPQYGSKILSIYHGDDLNQAMQRCGISDSV